MVLLRMMARQGKRAGKATAAGSRQANGSARPLVAIGVLVGVRPLGVEYSWASLADRAFVLPALIALGALLLFVAIGWSFKRRREPSEEEAYRKLFDCNPQPMLIYDAEELRLVAVNDAAVELFGLTREELLLTELKEVLPCAESEPVARAQRFKHDRADGSWVNVEAVSQPMTLGEVNAVLVVVRDISSRVGVEEALAHSQALFRSVIEGVSQPIFCKDLNGRYTHANKAFCAAVGRSAGELIGRSDYDIYSEEQARRCEEADRRVIGTGVALSEVEEKPCVDGRPSYSRVMRSARRDARGRIAGVVGLVADITESKRLEAALGESEARCRELLKSAAEHARTEEAFRRSQHDYRSLFESAGDAIVIFAPKDERILEANARACELYGYSHEEFVGMSLKQVTKDVSRGEQQVNRILKMGSGRNFETVHLRRDGSPIHILANCSVVEYGGRQAILSIHRDVSERHQGEQVIQRGLENFLAFVSRVAEGDLTARGEEGDDAIGVVTRSVNRMLDNFGAILVRVKQTALSVSTVASQILAASEQVLAAAQRQADEITGTVSAVEQMASSMTQVSGNAEASAGAAHNALGAAERGDQSVRETSDAMARIDAAVQHTAEKMKLLVRRSAEISEITALINEIASQTNLLSLNAAIEAAHAGDSGLGFGVVAEEIRKLAEKSARATKEIDTLIKAVQRETSEALAAMEDGMKEVEGGSRLAQQARHSLEEVSGIVRQSARLVEEISAASDQQARVTATVASAMQTVSSITLETSASAQQTSETIQGLVAFSEQLNDAISVFKVKDGLPCGLATEAPALRPAG
jgi:PAS domain S-box-containing protein